MKITIDDKIYLINENSKSHRKLVAFLKSVDYFYQTTKYDKTFLENRLNDLQNNLDYLRFESNELHNKYDKLLKNLSILEQSNSEFIKINVKLIENKNKLKETVDAISKIKDKLNDKENRFKYNKISIEVNKQW